jgi:hypothetical protein
VRISELLQRHSGLLIRGCVAAALLFLWGWIWGRNSSSVLFVVGADDDADADADVQVRGRHQQEICLGFLGIRFEEVGKSSRCRCSISRRQRWDRRNRREECNELVCLLKLFVSLWWWRQQRECKKGIALGSELGPNQSSHAQSWQLLRNGGRCRFSSWFTPKG